MTVPTKVLTYGAYADQKSDKDVMDEFNRRDDRVAGTKFQSFGLDSANSNTGSNSFNSKDEMFMSFALFGYSGRNPGGKQTMVTNGISNTKTLDSVISLPMPQNPTVQYSPNWDHTNTSPMLQSLSSGAGITDSIANAWTGGTLEHLGFKSMEQLAGLIGKSDTNATGVAGNIKQKMVNNHKEMFFDSIGFRSFNFQWQFAPKNLNESEAIKDIFKSFKKHSLPSLIDNNKMFKYPSLIQAKYETMGEDIMNKFKPAVVTNIEVDYSTGNAYAAFNSGHPVTVKFSLSLTEIEIVTEVDIDQGF